MKERIARMGFGNQRDGGLHKKLASGFGIMKWFPGFLYKPVKDQKLWENKKNHINSSLLFEVYAKAENWQPEVN